MILDGDTLTAPERALVSGVCGPDTVAVRRPAQGRDNSVAIIDERWVVRTPKTPAARLATRNESAVLHALPAECRVPRPIVATADGMVYEFIPGRSLNAEGWTDFDAAAQRVLAEQFRVILDALHTLPVDVLHEPDEILDPGWVLGSIERCVHMEPRRPLGFEPRELVGRFEQAWALDAAPRTIVHVDLKTPHLLVDGRRASIIDFGGACLGDPALDYGVMAFCVGDDLLDAMRIGNTALAARARCYADLYALRMATRGWTQTAPRWK